MDKENFLERSLTQQIYILNKNISSYIDMYLQKNLTIYIPKLEGSILSYLGKQRKEKKTVTSTDISNHFTMNKVTISQAVNSLINKGYITFEVVTSDRRQKIVSLTPSGQKVIKQLDEVFLKLNEEFNTILKKDEKEKVSESLYKLFKYVKEDKNE